ncbi:uncharacterized protein LOC132199370 isoform X2 [Neocloeon triangulifer]|uniref:uncharacterized protein LOC132199370 isoform X2 n=1 Tax=Neocloeon triangulifer TaxID=2078957 RepID=UPI00286FA118|nr:uncharacterized protein LOC132199370 isoform X2 [Neocloeon triangulifer]
MSVQAASRGAPAGAPTSRHSSSLLACVRESSPPSDPGDEAPAAGDSVKNGSTTHQPEPKKRRFHPLRGLKRMFRRAPRVPEAPQDLPEQMGESCNPNGGDHLMVPEVHLRSRSASELMDSTQELRKRSAGGLSGSSHGGSAGVLSGGLSLSHDSIFTSESRAGSSSPRGGSAMDIPESFSLHHKLNGAVSPLIGVHPNGPIASHAGVRAELFEAVRRRRGRSRSEDEEEDLGLPSSPYGVSPTTADEHNNTGAHSTCSDGSLLSMGSTEMDEDFQISGGSVQLFAADRSHSDGVRDMESENGDKIPPLSHIAAKHKIAVRPKRTHGPPRLRRLQTTPSVLPSTPEAAEETGALPVDFKKGHAPLSFEAMLERQLKSASLPPGLALAAASNAPATEVKLSRSHSSTEQPNPALVKPAYRRAVSAVRIEQAALASAAASKFSAMFGESTEDEKPEKLEIDVKPEKIEAPRPEKREIVKPDKLDIKPDRPVPLPRVSPIKKVEEATSPVKEIKSILKKEEKAESPTRKDARSPPILAPKPEPRRISSASSRQRVEPVLVHQKAEIPPPSPVSPVTPVSPSNFVLVSYTDDSLDTHRGSEFSAQSPSSLDSLEDFRRIRSPSQSQMDSLERNLKISSDSLSSGTELSSTSDDVRPTPRFRQSWLPTSDSSEDKIEVRPVKLRVVKSRHSDPPVSIAPPDNFIRKSSSVDSMLSDNNNSSGSHRKTSSNDSISSTEEVNLRPSEIRKRLKDNEWPVRVEKSAKPSTPEFLRLQLNPVESKQETPVAKVEPSRRSSSSSVEELDKPKLLKQNSSPQRLRLFTNPTAVEVKAVEKKAAETKAVEVLPKSPEVKLFEAPKVVKSLAVNGKSTEERGSMFKSKSIDIEVAKPQIVNQRVKPQEEAPPLQILPSKLKLVEEPKVQNGHQNKTKAFEEAPQSKPNQNGSIQEVVLRRKPSAVEAKSDECELFKVFARRSLKVTKDSDNNWETLGAQKSRDSDKENDEEAKPTTMEKTLNSINNNTVPTSMANNNNSLNRRPQTFISKSPEHRLERPVQDNKAPRPKSFSWGIKDKEIELVNGSNSNSGMASLPPNVSLEKATIKTMTPTVKKKLNQWERWAQQGGKTD